MVKQIHSKDQIFCCQNLNYLVIKKLTRLENDFKFIFFGIYTGLYCNEMIYYHYPVEL